MTVLGSIGVCALVKRLTFMIVTSESKQLRQFSVSKRLVQFCATLGLFAAVALGYFTFDYL